MNGAGVDIDTADIIDHGQFRDFLERTGIVAHSRSPDDFLSNLTDHTIAAINNLTGASLAHIRANFPVTPQEPIATGNAFLNPNLIVKRMF